MAKRPPEGKTQMTEAAPLFQAEGLDLRMKHQKKRRK
jgi:hypothetical protein